MLLSVLPLFGCKDARPHGLAVGSGTQHSLSMIQRRSDGVGCSATGETWSYGTSAVRATAGPRAISFVPTLSNGSHNLWVPHVF